MVKVRVVVPVERRAVKVLALEAAEAVKVAGEDSRAVAGDVVEDSANRPPS